jgi:phage repressor protein C with HTH and peptisase S24 domain
MTFQGFTRIWYGGRFPKAETLIKIKQLTNCNLNWLLTSEGEPTLPARNKDEINSNNDGNTEDLNNSIDINDFVFIPCYANEALAELGSFPVEEKAFFI